jgi:beta-phosphoglucomutase-like phosphatase (HAD superfamily)
MEPARVVAVDDSSYGYSSAHEAGMGVIQFAHDGQPPVSPDVIAVCRDFDEVSVTVDTLLAAGE